MDVDMEDEAPRKDGDDEVGDEEEESNYIEPVVDGRDIKFKTKTLNKYLVCHLCEGYFKEPYTVKECLHTFCKSCVYKYFQTNNDCPKCKIYLSPKPFEAIRYDRALEQLVIKIFPDVIKQDAIACKQFYESQGIEPETEVSEAINKVLDDNIQQSHPKLKNSKANSSKRALYHDAIQFKLQLDNRPEHAAAVENLKPLDRPIITTSARVTIRHLKKFIMMETGVSNPRDIEIVFKDEVLGPEHTIDYILKTRGHDPKTQALFYYRKRLQNAMLA